MGGCQSRGWGMDEMGEGSNGTDCWLISYISWGCNVKHGDYS